LSSSLSEDQTLFGRILHRKLKSRWDFRFAQLTLEAFGAVLLAFGLCHALQLQSSGLVSMFLASATMRDRMVALLSENRRLIQQDGAPPMVANQRTVMGVLAMFAGTFVGYLLIALYLLPDRLEQSFDFALRSVVLEPGDSLFDVERFQDILWLLGNNLSVASVIFALAVFYRAYGAVLVLCWNAVVWATALSLLGLGAVEGTQTAPAAVFVVSSLAVVPHLVAEALGYCLSAIAAIFLSLAVSKYPTRDPRFLGTLVSVRQLSLLAFGFLVLGAVLEVSYAPAVLRYFR
jgi:hypothetical protein